MTNPRQGVKKSGPLTAYVCTDSIDGMSKKDFPEILQDFNDFLYDECQLKSGFSDK